jgi:hypothetical protein
MTRISAFSIGGLLALSTIALAWSDPVVTGVWKLSAGKNDAPCMLTLAVDPADDEAGTALPSTDCASGLNAIARWRKTPAGIELLGPDGGMVAALKDRNGTFAGSRIADGKALSLDR